MKAFNKLFSLVVASVLVFSLAGCGDKEESKKFSANLNGTEIAITYVYKGDKVLKEGANKRGNSSRLTQSFHFFMFEPIFSPVNALNQPI